MACSTAGVRRGLAGLLLVAGCFDPAFREPLACGPGGACPPGYACDAPTDTCRREGGGGRDAAANVDGPGGGGDGGGRIDAAPGRPDARPVPDAAPPIDATPVGCTGDGDCLTPPTPCRLPGTCGDGGECIFPLRDCSSLDGECTAGVCNPSSGICEAMPAHAGAACGPAPSCIYGACGFADGCAESGTASGTCTESHCAAGACTPMTTPSTQPCSRDTDGLSCGGTTCGPPFGGCDYDDVCDTSGSRTTTCTRKVCGAGACGDSAPFTGTEPCSRGTDGVTCDATTCGGYGPCNGFAGDCAVDGTQSRTCTDWICGGGFCGTRTRSESRDCARPEPACPDDTVSGCGGCNGALGACTGTALCTCESWSCDGTNCVPSDSTCAQGCDMPNGTECSIEDCGAAGCTRPVCCSDGACDLIGPTCGPCGCG